MTIGPKPEPISDPSTLTIIQNKCNIFLLENTESIVTIFDFPIFLLISFPTNIKVLTS